MIKILTSIVILILAFIFWLTFYPKMDDKTVDQTKSSEQEMQDRDAPEESPFSELPEKISVEDMGNNTIRFSHKVPYEHRDFCNLENPETLTDFVDFSADLSVSDLSIRGLLTEKYEFLVDEVLNQDDSFKVSPGFVDEVEVGDQRVYKISIGAEGCGQDIYVMKKDQKTIIVENKLIPQLNQNVVTQEVYNEFSSLPEVILSAENEEILSGILKELTK